MKKTLLFFLLTSLFVTNLFADVPFRNQRRDMFRMLPINQNSIVFLGNSITQGNEWAEAFGNNPLVVNRGISGNTSVEVMNNLDFVVSGKPAKIFLLIGINDNADPAVVVPNIRRIIEIVQRESSATQLFVQSILPAKNNANVTATNTQLQALCTEKGVTYIDIFSKLGGTPTNLSLSAADSNDGIHLLGSGYRKWVAGYDAYTGIVPVISNGANTTIPSAHHGYVNQRLSGFALLPSSPQDILMLGDWHVNTGEWRELLRDSNVKNRGIGVDKNTTSLSLVELKEMIPHIVKNNPAKVFIACGIKDLEHNGKTVVESITTYQQILTSIKSAAPQTEIYIQSLIPSTTASVNTNKFVPFNAQLATLANASEKIYFVDVYSALVSSDVLNGQYSFGNGGLNGRGYLKWAEILAPNVNATIQPFPVAMYDLKIAIGASRQQVIGAIEGNVACGYSTAAVNAFRDAISAADIVAHTVGATEIQMQQQLTALTTAKTTLHASEITLPQASTAGNEHWFRISAPLRNANVYMKSGGVAQGVVFVALNNFKSQQWKLVLRGDMTYNIVNRNDNSFLSPVATNNTQLKTTGLEPASGWTLQKGADLSKLIIVSGTSQLNLTGSNLLFNWGSGTNTTDSGCQMLFSEVTQAADDDPKIEVPSPLLIKKNIICDGLAPILVDAIDAAPVLATNTLTVAIDFTPAVTSGDAILVASTDTDVANKFFGIGTLTNFTKYGVRYVGDNELEGYYTQNYSNPANRHRLVVVMSAATSAYKFYLDEGFGRDVTGMGAYGYSYFGKINNPKLYLGGVVSSGAPNRYPFKGTLHSVQFFPGVLSAEQVAAIDYQLIGSSIGKPISGESEKPFAVVGRSIQIREGVKAKVFDITGKQTLDSDLMPGCYILHANNRAFKFIVR